MKWKKTRTLADSSGNPIVTLYPGHVSAFTFNLAFIAEGWKADRIKKTDLKHEYWLYKDRKFTKYSEGVREVKPFTAMYW